MDSGLEVMERQHPAITPPPTAEEKPNFVPTALASTTLSGL